MKRSSLLLGVALSLVSMGAMAAAKPATTDKAASTAPAKKTTKKAPAKKAPPKPSNDNG